MGFRLGETHFSHSTSELPGVAPFLERGGQDFAGRSGSFGSKARVPVNRRQPMLALVV